MLDTEPGEQFERCWKRTVMNLGLGASLLGHISRGMVLDSRRHDQEQMYTEYFLSGMNASGSSRW